MLLFSLANFTNPVHSFVFFPEMANKRDSQQQQNQGQKKTTGSESKKTNEVDEGATASSSAAPSDVYEFVSTPKHSSCSSGSGDENPSKNSDKSSDDKSGTDSDNPTANLQQKRAAADQQDGADESSSTADEDAKRKKRKDSELKEGIKPTVGTNRVTSRVGVKPPGPASKTMGLVNKVSVASTSDRKSPCEVSTMSPASDGENDDSKDPKVPPLKIVIPQQAPGAEPQETQTVAQRATSKATTLRNHPYVVASSNSNDGTSSDKDGPSVRGLSPSAESNKSEDTNKPTGKSKEPRILRSSRKDAKDDRGSNNSSPQLPVSSTPSPAQQNAESAAGNDSENQQNSQNVASSSSSSTSTSSTTTTVTSQTSSIQGTSQVAQQQQQNPVDLHPRKRKIKASREPSSGASSVDVKDSNSKDGNELVHPHDQPFTNCYQMYIDLRKQIAQRHSNLHPVEPRPLKGLEDYLMNRRTYLLQGKSSIDPNVIVPPLLPPQMKETFIEQEKERHKLKLRHIVEKEKMVLSKEQEILRVHCKAAQMIANQSQPFSVCTILKDEEVYNIITPEQEEKYRNKNRERSHGRVFYQALKELDDKYDKIKVRSFKCFASSAN